MANIKGRKLATEQFPLLIEMNPKRVITNDKGEITGRYLSAQIDQSLKKPDKVKTGEMEGVDTNPYLASNEVTNPNAPEGQNKYVNHTVRYAESQYQKMVEAANAGKTKKEVTLDNGNILLGLKGSLQMNAKKELIVNTSKPLEPTNNPRFGKSTLDKQSAVTAAAKEYRSLSREADKVADSIETPETSVEAEAGVEME